MPPDVSSLGNLLNRTAQHVEAQRTTAAPAMDAAQGQAPHSHLDVMTRTWSGLTDHLRDGDLTDLAPVVSPLVAAGVTLPGVVQGLVGPWSHASASGIASSVKDQANVVVDQLSQLFHLKQDEHSPKGVLQHIGLALGVLTSIEQGLSSLLSFIPFPALPAVHVLNFDVGLPHTHTHPPNLIPPAPPIPLPSTGPVIPIPIASGAANVLINGLPAARCGDMGLGIWCGGYCPIYEIFLGSSSVWLEGARAARVGVDITKHCTMFDAGAGATIGFTISASGNVSVGGIPMPSLTNMALGAAMNGLFKGLGKVVRGIWNKIRASNWVQNMEKGFWKCKVFRAEPVSILTGEVVVEQKDFSLPWPMPLEWTRRYRSGNTRTGVCGPGWETVADARLVLEEDGSVVFYNGQTGGAFFESLPEDSPVEEAVNGGILKRAGQSLTVRVKGGKIYQFPGFATGQSEVLVESITDLCGNSLHFMREEGSLKQIVSSVGPCVEVQSRAGRIEQLMLYHPMEKEPRLLARYVYDEAGDLRSVIDPLGHPYRFEYATHCLVKHTDRNGLSFYYEFDKLEPEGRVLHTWGDGGLYDYRFQYNKALRRTTITNSLGHTSIIEHDDCNLPILEADPLGGMTAYEYDDCGRTCAVVDPGGRRTEYHYDKRGNLVKLVRPDGVAILAEFDQSNKLISVTDPNGNVWRQEWDVRGLLAKQISPVGATTKFEYNHRGQLVLTQNPRGFITRMEFDSYGNLVGLIDALGHKSELQIDALGNVLVKIDPLGHKTVFQYDDRSRIISLCSPTDAKSQYSYDGEGNLLSFQDADGFVTRLEYRGLGEVARRIQPDGYTIEYHHDSEERLVKVTNQRGQNYHLRRDALGRCTEETDYWGQSRKYEYNLSGFLQRSIDAGGRVIEYRMDSLGRLIEKTLPGGNKEKFTYDAIGNLIETVNQSIRVSRIFDALGRILEETHEGFKVSNAYDLHGNRIKRQTSLGNTVLYEYDELDRVRSVKINDAEPIVIERNAKGQAIVETLAPGLRRSYRYNHDGSIANQQVETNGILVGRREYGYNRRGELVRLQDSVHGVEEFLYDPMRRVREHLTPEGKLQKYLYDPTGDLLRSSSRPQDALEARERIEEYKGVSYHFNACGSLIEKRAGGKVLKLEWDANNRLVRSDNWDGSTSTYGYDAQGRRVFKNTQEKKVSFNWDEDVLLSDTHLDQCREFVFHKGTSIPLAIIGPDRTILYFQADPNGAPVRLFDIHGKVLWSARYDATGNFSELAEYSNQPLRLQGQYFDTETGLAYNRHRYFDGMFLGFISSDPVSLLSGTNLYQYAPNCLMWVDPLGLNCDYVNLASPKRTEHILTGDETGGGHLWPGKDGKTPFPQDWFGEKIMHHVSDIATDPKLQWINQTGKQGALYTKAGDPTRMAVIGEREGVKIKIIIEPAGEGIITAFPL